MKSRGHNSQFSIYEIRTSLMWQSNVTGVHVNELCQSLSLFHLEGRRAETRLLKLDSKHEDVPVLHRNRVVFMPHGVIIIL